MSSCKQTCLDWLVDDTLLRSAPRADPARRALDTGVPTWDPLRLRPESLFILCALKNCLKQISNP